MVSVEDVAALQSVVSGPVFLPGATGYSDEVFAYNAAVQHTPEVVVGAVDAADVASSVAWAAERDIPVAVQATGHGATAVVTAGLLITTRRMQDIEVDPVARTARVGAGVKWGALLAASVPHGLIGLNGSSSDVGIVGYTLGGGLPVLGRALGFAADRVRSMQVVTADGRLRDVDAQRDPELFALMRGGKGNLGIVTSMVFELVPVDEFYGGGLFYPGAEAATVLAAFREWVPTLPESAVPSVALLRLPDMELVPEPLRGKFVVHVRFAFLGGKDEGDRLLAPMRALGSQFMDTAAPMSYLDIDTVHADPEDPIPYEEGGALLREFGEEAQRALLSVAGPEAQTPLLMIEVRVLGGALARASSPPDAVSGRDAPYSILTIGALVPPIAELVPGAIAALLDTMSPYATGATMVNFHGRPGDATDRARAWSPETYDAIVAAKRRYDPKDLFRFGHAVLIPSGEAAAPATPL